MKPVDFRFCNVASLDVALDLLADKRSDVKVISGSQSLGPMLNLRLARPEVLVNISELDELRQTHQADSFVEIGAAIRHGEIEDGTVPDPINGMLQYVAHGIAYRAVRNRGTIGGSICHADPAADWVTTLVALDASLSLAAKNNTRSIPMRSFMKGAYRTAIRPDEVLTSIRIPKYSKSAVWGYYKVTRKVGEFADAIACWVADSESRYSRMVFGSTSGAPIISSQIAADVASTGKCPDKEKIIAELIRVAPELDDIKKHLMAVACKRCIEKALKDV